MGKHIHRSVEFDAMTMQSARDIRCRGPVLNLGNAPQLWSITATVIVRSDDGGEVHHSFSFRPSSRVPLGALNSIIADELLAADYDRGAVVSIPVRAVIRDR